MATIAISGLSLTVGLIFWILLRDRQKREKEKEKRYHALLEEARRESAKEEQVQL